MTIAHKDMVSRKRLNGVVLLFLLFVTCTNHAENSTNNGCQPVIAADRDWHVIIVRPHENAYLVCTLTRTRLRDLIGDFLDVPENQQVEFKSLFLGRLVDHPWLSKYLATHALADAGWDKIKGQPRSGYINKLVQDILSTPEMLSQIQEFFSDSGYTVTGASVEKVLVTRAGEIDWLEIHEPVLVPYDALTHFILKKTEPE